MRPARAVPARQAVAEGRLVPFTPYHVGPGIAAKAVLRGAFSLAVFGWAQVLMDLQPFVVNLTGEGQFHGLSHTVVGAVGLGVVAAVTGKPLSDAAVLAAAAYGRTARRLSWGVVWWSALVGTFSHLAFDSVLNVDVHPWAPFAAGNPLYGRIPAVSQHSFYVASGVIGAALWLLGSVVARRRARAIADRA